MNNFEQQVTQLTGRSTAVGINEFLFERRYKTGKEEGARLERTKAEEEKIAEKLESARELKNLGTPLEVISQALKLSIEQIQVL